jgi:hypothetical protein
VPCHAVCADGRGQERGLVFGLAQIAAGLLDPGDGLNEGAPLVDEELTAAHRRHEFVSRLFDVGLGLPILCEALLELQALICGEREEIQRTAAERGALFVRALSPARVCRDAHFRGFLDELRDRVEVDDLRSCAQCLARRLQQPGSRLPELAHEPLELMRDLCLIARSGSVHGRLVRQTTAGLWIFLISRSAAR